MTQGTGRATRDGLRDNDIRQAVADIFATDVHARRVMSLGNAVVGAVHGVALTVHAIGHGLSIASGLVSKSAIKQVDRLLSNQNLNLWQEIFPAWMSFVLSERKEVVVAMDWTEFDADDHATIALHVVTSHGRTTPLMWKTHKKSTLKKRRNDYEDELLARFRELLPQDVRAIVLADRGFGDQAIYKALSDAHIDYVIRFRGNILVESAKETKAAADWVPTSGQARKIKHPRVTSARTEVAAVVCKKAKNMKEPWCLATSLSDRAASKIVKLYAKRFRIEENFRDTKDLRFGMGLSSTHIGRCDRRDRLLLIGALAQALLTLLGAAAEACGLDRTMKANTVTTRTYSLFRQGCFFYACIPTMREPWLVQLMQSFRKIVANHAVFRDIFGII
jgi:hypothetical protein